MRPVSGCHKARDPYYPRGRGLAKCSFWREISHRGWRKMAFVCALSNSIRVRTWRALKNFDLQQLYDAALRRWAQIQTPSQLFSQSTYMTEEVRRRVLIERNAAKSRLSKHQQNCRKCRPCT
jgi:hypothetical protein